MRPGDTLFFLLLSIVLSPSSGPSIPGILGERRSWLEATFLSIFSAPQSVSNTVSLLCLFSTSHSWACTRFGAGPRRRPPQHRPGAPSHRQWLQIKQVGNSRAPLSPKGEHVTRSDKGGVNHAPVLWGISPKTCGRYQVNRKKDTKQYCLREVAIQSRCPVQQNEGLWDEHQRD